MRNSDSSDLDAETPAGSSQSMTRWSLRWVLGLAVATLLAVLFVGMRFAQQGTGRAGDLVGAVETRYAPLLRMSRDLREAITAFDRTVVGLPPAVSPNELAELRAAGTRMLQVYDEYARLAPPSPADSRLDLRDRLEDFRSQGLAIGDLHTQRSADIRRSLTALDSLAARAARAGDGISVGDEVLARRSLAEVARAAAALRASVTTLFASPSSSSARAVAADEATFARLLHEHSAELARSPGRAWLELEREDFADASHAEARFQATEQKIDAARSAFSVTAYELAAFVESDLQEPAWSALSEAAGRAHMTAVDAERQVIRTAVGVVLVVLLIAAIVIYGITVPARRLLHGTRRLTRGALDARVPRGGVRELDELAAAFNDMAKALDSTQNTLRTERAALEDRVAERTAQLRQLANFDPLTELPNRRELSSHLGAAILRAKMGASGCAVFYMDIDNFKTINDTLGHQFGDSVLRAIASRLQEVAGTDGFLARLGGDEFTLVIEGLESAESAKARVDALMGAFQRPVRVGERNLLIALSVGIALCPEHGDTSEALLRAADSALFHAKDRGRNGYSLYRAELHAAASHRFHTEQGLRRALETGDFLLHYQPEVSLAGVNTTVVEALLRWRQPDGRIAPASEFIAIAEQSGLLLELNDWVLRSAINAAKELRRHTWPDARVAVNVSAQQFLTGRFVESLEKALSDEAMPPNCLEIELTETAVQTGRMAIEALRAVRHLGVSVALDDFGAGYSSLKSIDELPLSRVKLDRSLIKDIDTNSNAAAIAHSIIRLCLGLGLTVTAEGIEKHEQLDVLAACGDVHVQGFLIARPGPLVDVARFIPETAVRLAAVWPKLEAFRRAGTMPRETAATLLRWPRTR